MVTIASVSDRYRHYNVPDTSEKSRGVNAVCRGTWNNRAYPEALRDGAKVFDNVGGVAPSGITHTEINNIFHRADAQPF